MQRVADACPHDQSPCPVGGTGRFPASAAGQRRLSIAVDRAGKRRLGRAVLAVVEGVVTAKILRKRAGKFHHAPANSRDDFGVPVRVGIAPTKTLAKCANDIAKKKKIFAGVLDMMDPRLSDWLLPFVPVGDIWGIGRRTKAKLQGVGIGTAAELRAMPPRQARAMGTVILERTVLEVQGELCIAFDHVAPPRKGMAVTRSAGTPMINFDTVFQAITAHATRAAEKLRQHGLVAGTMTVFFHTNRHRPDRPQYAGSRTTRLVPMSSDTLNLVAAARRCAQAAWPKSGAFGYAFTKAGVLLDDLLPLEDRPRTLFDAPHRTSYLMAALDAVNAWFGKKTMVLASEGMERSWQLRADHRSPRYTTRMADLPVVR